MTTDQPLLRVEDLQVEYAVGDDTVNAVRGVSFSVARSEMVGIVGESGCGKSATAKAILRLVGGPGRIAAGSVTFDGRDLVHLPKSEMSAIRGNEISMIFQDPMTSLNPVISIGRQIDDVLKAHTDLDRATRERRAVELLELVGIPLAATRLGAYPHEFSGGMRQRVMIAMALANSPKLLIADEPTTALDVTVQAQILGLLTELNQELGMAVLFISHDLRVVSDVCHRTLVFYAGRIVEEGRTSDVFDNPHHPYTRALFQAVPEPRVGARRPLLSISGAPPELNKPIEGCSFAPRCPDRFERCSEDPSLMRSTVDRYRACWRTPGESSGRDDE